MTDQKRTALDWQDVRIFLALAHQGSLSAAARMLSVNHATIARRLHSLEESLREKLVERRPDGYALTLAGTHALHAASDMEQAAQILSRGMQDGTPSGLVRISASPGLTGGFLISRLPALTTRYPKLDIDLSPALLSISSTGMRRISPFASTGPRTATSSRACWSLSAMGSTGRMRLAARLKRGAT